MARAKRGKAYRPKASALAPQKKVSMINDTVQARLDTKARSLARARASRHIEDTAMRERARMIRLNALSDCVIESIDSFVKRAKARYARLILRRARARQARFEYINGLLAKGSIEARYRHRKILKARFNRLRDTSLRIWIDLKTNPDLRETLRAMRANTKELKAILAFTGNYELRAEIFGSKDAHLTWMQNAIESDFRLGLRVMQPPTMCRMGEQIGYQNDLRYSDFSLIKTRKGSKKLTPKKPSALVEKDTRTRSERALDAWTQEKRECMNAEKMSKRARSQWLTKRNASFSTSILDDASRIPHEYIAINDVNNLWLGDVRARSHAIDHERIEEIASALAWYLE